jgi:hypothetical protein
MYSIFAGERLAGGRGIYRLPCAVTPSSVIPDFDFESPILRQGPAIDDPCKPYRSDVRRIGRRIFDPEIQVAVLIEQGIRLEHEPVFFIPHNISFERFLAF